jgi:hypothetical protein
MTPTLAPQGAWGVFDYRIEALSDAQLTEHFSDLIDIHSWSAVKFDLYGLKFFTVQHWAQMETKCNQCGSNEFHAFFPHAAQGAGVAVDGGVPPQKFWH